MGSQDGVIDSGLHLGAPTQSGLEDPTPDRGHPELPIDADGVQDRAPAATEALEQMFSPSLKDVLSLALLEKGQGREPLGVKQLPSPPPLPEVPAPMYPAVAPPLPGVVQQKAFESRRQSGATSMTAVSESESQGGVKKTWKSSVISNLFTAYLRRPSAEEEPQPERVVPAKFKNTLFRSDTLFVFFTLVTGPKGP